VLFGAQVAWLHSGSRSREEILRGLLGRRGLGREGLTGSRVARSRARGIERSRRHELRARGVRARGSEAPMLLRERRRPRLEGWEAAAF